MMKPEIVKHLLETNQRFYQKFGKAFAVTRRRIQPGVRRILDGLPGDGKWLDIGCGGGGVSLEWANQPGRQGSYTGVDLSDSLLAEARKIGAHLPGGEAEIHFLQADISKPSWISVLGDQRFDIVLAFAVLHHLPGIDLRVRLLRQIRERILPAGLFIHSEWQFQHSERLMSRRLPWDTVGLADEDVDKGDTLLDWRFSLPDQEEKVGIRYVHLFTHDELRDMAKECGFEIIDEFESDGKGGKLGLYQVWRRDPESL